MAAGDKKTRFIMVQGTMSGAGKSLVVAGLCRVLFQDGFKVAPFKSQNMALNSFVTKEGLEMGRAQVMQAEAAGVEPVVAMNPILLKPTDDVGSQVIVNGKVLGNMKAKEYFAYKKSLVPEIMAAVNELEKDFDVIVIEGAGSPAEINLKENDIVNMGMAELVDAPVLLVGDIDRGGVFAQLYGTVALLEEDEKTRIKGLVINKFRGDKSILDPGVKMIEEKSGIPVVGVLPFMDISLEDEDSLSERFYEKKKGLIDIAVIRLPHISNFTDFNVFDEFPDVSVRYVKDPGELGNPDLLVIPGSKSTIDDMRWMREKSLDLTVKRYAGNHGPVIGICGGFQMLGEVIRDPEGVEGGGETYGLGLLPLETTLKGDKVRSLTSGIIEKPSGIFEGLKGASYEGYEIHMGETKETGAKDETSLTSFTDKNTGYCCGNVYGTYIHGFFDKGEVALGVVNALAKKKGISLGKAGAAESGSGNGLNLSEICDYRQFKEVQYDKLADMIRQYMDMDEVYRIMGIGTDNDA